LEKDEAKWKVKLEDLRKEANELEAKKIEGAKVQGGVGLTLLKDIENEYNSKTEALINEVSDTFFHLFFGLTKFMITSCTLDLYLIHAMLLFPRQANKWRDQYHASRSIYEELHAQYEHLQGRSERERIVAESIRKEINSLQQALAEQIKRSDNGTTSTEGIAHDLKHQLAERDLRLDKLNQEVKAMQKARDDAVSNKDELAASHQVELAVSLDVHRSINLQPTVSSMCGCNFTIYHIRE
jgi:hypothetical protein